MPVYEYKCTECNARFEVEQRMTEDPLTTLPGEDHVHTLKKVFSPVGIAFKGSGFYKTDSAASRPKTSSTESTAEKDTKSPSSSDSAAATSSPAAGSSTE